MTTEMRDKMEKEMDEAFDKFFGDTMEMLKKLEARRNRTTKTKESEE